MALAQAFSYSCSNTWLSAKTFDGSFQKQGKIKIQGFGLKVLLNFFTVFVSEISKSYNILSSDYSSVAVFNGQSHILYVNVYFALDIVR